MNKVMKFQYDFEDTSPSTLRWDYENVVDDRLSVELIDGEAFLYVNRDAALVLARAFAQLALGSYTNGFHVHVYRDFDADKAVALTLVLEPHQAVPGA